MKGSSRLLTRAFIAVGLIAVTCRPLFGQTATALRVVAAPANLFDGALVLDHPALNRNPKAKPVLTQFWDGVSNPHPVAVQYHLASSRWRIVNGDGTNLPAGAKFNVLLAPGARSVLASAANSTANVTLFPFAKGNPNARLFLTRVTNPVLSLPPTLSTRHHGLYFIGPGPAYGNQWCIFAQDEENIGALGFHLADATRLKNGASPAAFSFVTAVENITQNHAAISHPLADGNPDALLFVQHVFTGASPTYLDEAVGVFYSGTRWRIFNQDLSPMPANAAFHVLVLPPP
jgi:hypothetical protein